MQFPVPQFTDVEDKIIAGLTFKQFAIVFGAAVFVFVIYTITKSGFASAITAIFVGLPALALTFGKLNGRPLFASAGNFVKYLFGPKVYVYHKEGKTLPVVTRVSTESDIPTIKVYRDSAVKINELNYLLQQQQAEEERLVELIKQNQQRS